MRLVYQLFPFSVQFLQCLDNAARWIDAISENAIKGTVLRGFMAVYGDFRWNSAGK